MLECFRGEFLSANKFKKEDNNIIYVFPYGILLDKMRGKYPVKCFIRINSITKIVGEIIEDTQ